MSPNKLNVKDAHEDGLRRTYLVTIAMIWLFVAIRFLLGITVDPFVNIAIPALLVYLGLVLLGCWWRLIHVQTVGVLALLALVTVVFMRLLLWRVGVLVDFGTLGDSGAMAVQLAASFPIAFVVLGTRRGLQVSVLIYLAFVGLYGNVIIDGLLGRSSYPTSSIAASMAIAYAVLIATIRLLASRFEQLVSQQAKADVLFKQATTDPLTQIANRRHLDDAIDRLIAQSHRYGHPLSVVLIDLDRFKRVNDDHGHEVGDQVLIETVQRLLGTIRESDLLGRWGGEEFLLVAPNTDHADALALAERCRRALADMPMSGVGQVTASFGVATYAADDDARSMRRRADLALYTAKEEGRNRVIGLPDSDTQAHTTAAKPS
ncbi:MAG: diguanylate cyclase [Nitriliruptoraceae bacterium]